MKLINQILTIKKSNKNKDFFTNANNLKLL